MSRCEMPHGLPVMYLTVLDVFLIYPCPVQDSKEQRSGEMVMEFFVVLVISLAVVLGVGTIGLGLLVCRPASQKISPR